MNPKPPATRTGRSGRLGHHTTRFKSLAVLGALVLGAAGAAFAAATPALADPAPTYVQIGSDTTENLMDAFAASAGQGTLGSYDAVNPLSQVAAEQITAGPALPGGQQELCSFTRPNGSGQGFKSFDFSSNPNTTLNPALVPANNPQPGCITLSRSSSGPGSVSGTAGTPGSKETAAPFGNYVYVPAAADAVTWATGPTSPTAETTLCNGPTEPTGYTCSSTTGTGNVSFTSAGTNISQDLNLSVAQLQTLYHSCLPLTVGSVTLNPTAGVFNYSATSASPAVFTATGSAYAAGTAVILSGGTAPTGFTDGTTYFVVNPSGTTFQLAATSGGTAINSTSTGFGTVAIPGAVDLYAPQNGSGTLSFWESTMGNAGVTESCWHQTIQAGPATGASVEEHDGSAIASDPNAIAPNSIAKWVGMSNGIVIPDVRHGSILQPVVAPGIAFSATSATPAVFTAAGSSFTNGELVQLTPPTTGSLPGGFTAGTDYFVVGATSPAGDTFELSTTSGGAAMASTSAGTGNVNVTVAPISSGSMNISKCLTGGAAANPNFNQGLCFPITREVYNVVDWYQVNNTAPTLQTASPAGPAFAFTATAANPAVFTATGSGYANGQLVTLVGTTLPGGFTAGTNYYVCGSVTANTFSLCSTPEPGVLSQSSAPLASSSTGSGGVSDNPAFDPVLAGLVAGSTSGLCTSTFTIEQLGFGPLPSANSAFADQCGATTGSLRVQMNNTSAAG